jgi:hypothetical protein
MNIPRAQFRTELCPSCKSALDRGALICRSCGGVVPIEWGMRGLRDRLAELIDRGRRAFGIRGALIWLLALTPVLIAPPVLALIIILATREHGQHGDRALAGTVAIVNIVLSIIAWHWFAGFMFGFWPWLGHYFNLFPFGIEHNPGAKPLPI